MTHIPSADCPCKPKVIDNVGTVTIIHKDVSPKREASK